MTSIDTNVIIGLFNEDETFNLPAKRSLQKAVSNGPLTICAPVFVELCAMPKRDDFDLDKFLTKTRIDVDWMLEEEIWRKAGAANARHVTRRRENAQHSPKRRDTHETKRVAADFLIGAHAMVRGAELLTFDKGVFRTYFPSVKIVEP